MDSSGPSVWNACSHFLQGLNRSISDLWLSQWATLQLASSCPSHEASRLSCRFSLVLLFRGSSLSSCLERFMENLA
ncbi:hypothetical protein CEXT_186901 [Caerostris extrusa]|uniref:Uncharacterized protein n=1 Tax=Caerostris extrusa TaxID=172846 RepID=A0AAV4X6R5_CAEEX|nr:hypothetical protein CEXT_186901 [Caerostris extrusa]